MSEIFEDWHRNLIDEESVWLLKKIDWQIKSLDEDSWLVKKVDWQRKLIDEENWLTKKLDWQRKLTDVECSLTKKVQWQRKFNKESQLTNLVFEDRWIHLQIDNVSVKLLLRMKRLTDRLEKVIG